ncbi:MAG: hypothetical protein PVF17_12820 [Ignavibacteria bacterium]|jgi:hypothetical protein
MNEEFYPLSDPEVKRLATTVQLQEAVRKLNNDVKQLTEFSRPNIRYLIKTILFDKRLHKKYCHLRRLAIQDRKESLKIIENLKKKLEKKEKEIEKLKAWKNKKGKHLKSWIRKRKNNEK